MGQSAGITRTSIAPFRPLYCLPWVTLFFMVAVSLDTATGYGDVSGDASCHVSAAERHKSHVIRIGVILPFNGDHFWRLELTRPALEQALDYIHKTPGLLDNYTIELDYRDSKCSDVYGPLEAIDMYTKKTADAFLGPGCNYAMAAVARFAAVWKIPLLTATGLEMAFADKKEYRLTRLHGHYMGVAEFMVQVLHRFRYTSVGLLYFDYMNQVLGKSDCWFITEALFYALSNHLSQQYRKEFVETFNDTDQLQVDAKLRALSKISRGEIT